MAEQRTVLVVEDEVDGRAVVSHLLGHFGIAVDAVPTAEKALEYLKHHAYDGVIIDLYLPDMDGWELLEKILADPQIAHLPCVALTAYHTSAVRRQALEAGFAAYFSKPFDDMTFVREITKIIGGGA